jgi:Flp pilus assembly pilin Flp
MNTYQKNKIKGATMIEYILIITLISIAAVVIIGTVGSTITTRFTTVNSKL